MSRCRTAVGWLGTRRGASATRIKLHMPRRSCHIGPCSQRPLVQPCKTWLGMAVAPLERRRNRSFFWSLCMLILGCFLILLRRSQAKWWQMLDKITLHAASASIVQSPNPSWMMASSYIDRVI
jgi:hypothetical protein